ncbi:MAG: YbjN domain-containing protein [Spirochaetaceae bacterium]|jgi:hypothetical protein|nr:YbjN domain-containing protein [Spirochaetaceae bacterium]
MDSGNKIEQYLIELKYSYREIGENLWLIDDEENYLPEVAVMYDDPVVVFRVVMMDAPAERRLELFTRLLELNASDLVHGAYGLEDGKIVLINTLDYETMDFGEFRSTLDAFSLALNQHYPILSTYRG